MIKIFRKLRKALLSEGKSGKYLAYAVGEIFLVVIGILLALQINNWNESRKSTVREIKILKEIRSELSETLEDLRDDNDDNQRDFESTKIIYHTMLNRMPYHDSLNKHLMLTIDIEELSSKESAFESLKSIGMDAISNDSIRQQITDAYLGIYQMINKHIIKEDINNLKQLITPYLILDRQKIVDNPDLRTKVIWGPRDIPFIFKDYKAFLDDEYLLLAVTETLQKRYFQMQILKHYEQNMEMIISNISNEIQRLESK